MEDESYCIDRDEIEGVLSARAYAYALFQAVFGGDPCETTLGFCASSETREVMEFFLRDGGPGDRDALGAFLGSVAATADALPALEGEYMRLFVGPQSLPVVPWESAFLAGDRVLFTEATLEVRNAYRRGGFMPAGYPHVADDHIALELGFLASVGRKAAEALAAGEEGVAVEALEAAIGFLDAHLLRWCDAYAKSLAQEDRTGFYGAAANLMSGFARRDREMAEEIVRAIAAG